MLPQFEEKHPFNTANISAGLRMMLWGYFMKVVVADRLALYTGAVFGNLYYHSGITILVAAVFFSMPDILRFCRVFIFGVGNSQSDGI